MSSALMTAPAEGWYQDPADAGAWRWWDGTSWTDHIRPVEELPQSQPVPVQYAPVQAAPVPVQPVPEFFPPAGVVIEPVPTHAPVFDEIPATLMPAPQQLPAPQPAAVAEPAPQPEPKPEPVAAQTIPQPGEVAPAPVAGPTAGNVSLTPAIPVTDQMYWHSAAAEKIEVPRIVHASTGSGAVQRGPLPPSYVRDWNDLGAPNTAGVWLLALSPLLFVGVSMLIDIVDGLSGDVFGQFAMAVVAAVTVGLTWIFAYADQRVLTARGYHPPAIWWMLVLPPLIYMIARGRAVRREGMRAWPPELLFFFLLLAAGAVEFVTLGGLAALGLG